MVAPTDAEIDAMLQGTIRDDDVERFMQPLQPPSRLSMASTSISGPDATTSSAGLASSEVLFALHPPRGLVNLGNTCFLNAAVQALGHCTPLAAYLLQGLFVMDLNEANPLGTGCVLTMVFAAVLHELFALRPTTSASVSRSCRSTDASLAGSLSASVATRADAQAEDATLSAFPPFDFLYAVAQFCPYLATGEMHDAQELLGWLLDALHEDLNRVRRQRADLTTSQVVVSSQQSSEDMEERYAAEAWKNHLHRNRSVIVDLFQGQVRSQLRCQRCGARSLTFDPFLRLTLPLPAGVQELQLEDAIRHFCREEVLDSDNLWECPTCSHRVLAHKKLDLWKLPPLLMIQLKRFEWVEDTRSSPPTFSVRKLDGMVHLPEKRLDMRPLVAPEAPQKEPLLYDLVAVVDHLGRHVDEGHYTATCLRPDGWCHFDDARVAMLRPGARVVGRQNYVLFLERRGAPTEPKAIAEQRPSAPHAWPHVVDMDWSFLTGSEG
eukprot:UN0250